MADFFRAYYNYGFDRAIINTDLNLIGELETGPITHKLGAGVDRYRYKEDSPGFIGGSDVVPPLNVFAPAYGYFTGLLQTLVGPSRNNIVFRYIWSDLGFYAQDQISALDDRLHILLGAPWDKTYLAQSQTYGSNFADCFPVCNGYPMGQFPDKPIVSPCAAILFKLQDNVSVYGSYVHSLGNNNGGLIADGSHPPPEVGEQWESGIKAQWFDDRLTASAATFDLRKKNVLQPDPFNAGAQIAVGEVVSRGIRHCR